MKRRPVLFVFLAAFMIVIVEPTANAQIVPFKGGGSDSVYSPCTAAYSGDGKATHMGKLTYSGFAIPTPTSDPLVFTWVTVGHQMTAANGDQIFLTGVNGVVQFIPIDPLDPNTQFTAVWTGEFVVDGGTGRFANVSGVPGEPLDITAVNDPLTLPQSCPDDIWTFSWSIDGSIDLGKRK